MSHIPLQTEYQSLFHSRTTIKAVKYSISDTRCVERCVIILQRCVNGIIVSKAATYRPTMLALCHGCRQCRYKGLFVLNHAHSVADILLLVYMLYSVFFDPSYSYAYSTFHRHSRSLLLSGNKHDRTETLTQCADWSQFAVDYFLGILTYGQKLQTALEITLKYCSEAVCTLLLRAASAVKAVACSTASSRLADTCERSTH